MLPIYEQFYTFQRSARMQDKQPTLLELLGARYIALGATLRDMAPKL